MPCRSDPGESHVSFRFVFYLKLGSLLWLADPTLVSLVYPPNSSLPAAAEMRPVTSCIPLAPLGSGVVPLDGETAAAVTADCAD